jgi:hypothetical protein
MQSLYNIHILSCLHFCLVLIFQQFFLFFRNFNKGLTVIKLKEVMKSDQMNYVVILTSCGKSFGFDLKVKEQCHYIQDIINGKNQNQHNIDGWMSAKELPDWVNGYDKWLMFLSNEIGSANNEVGEKSPANSDDDDVDEENSEPEKSSDDDNVDSYGEEDLAVQSSPVHTKNDVVGSVFSVASDDSEDSAFTNTKYDDCESKGSVISVRSTEPSSDGSESSSERFADVSRKPKAKVKTSEASKEKVSKNKNDKALNVGNGSEMQKPKDDDNGSESSSERFAEDRCKPKEKGQDQ